MKRSMQLSALLVGLIALSALPVTAQHHPTPGATVTEHGDRRDARSPTHLYDALAGEWDVYAADGDVALMVIRAKWSHGRTYKFLSADTIETATMRKTDNGWVPTFPGSDALVMKRRHPVPTR